MRKNKPENLRTYRLYLNGFLLKIKLIKLKYKKIFLGVYFLISILDKKNMHVTGGILLKSIVGANYVYMVSCIDISIILMLDKKKPTPQKKTIITQQWANLSVSFRMVNWNNRIPSFAKVSPFHSPPSVLSASLFDAETEPTYSAIVLLVLSGNLMQLGTRQFI